MEGNRGKKDSRGKRTLSGAVLVSSPWYGTLMGVTYPDRYLLFMEYFNKHKYMSAQMTLDEEWLDTTGAEKNFYGGLIQVAVALYHLTNENAKGSGPTYQKARAMLEPYGSEHFGVNLQKLLADCDALFKDKVKPEDPAMTYTKFLPKIDFALEL